MSGQQTPALAIQQVNDVIPGTVPRIPGGGMSLLSRGDGKSAYWDIVLASGLPGEIIIDPSVAQNNFPRFKTVQAGLDYCQANAILTAVLKLPPGVTFTESLVLPAQGGDYEIKTVGYNRSTIVGNVSCNASGAFNLRVRFTSTFVSGDVTGVAANGYACSFFTQGGTGITGIVSLTGTGTGLWDFHPNGGGFAGVNFTGGIGGFGKDVVVSGSINAVNTAFGGNITCGDISNFQGCRLNAGGLTTTRALGMNMTDCIFVVPVTLTGPANSLVVVDGVTLNRLSQVGVTLTGGIALTQRNSNLSTPPGGQGVAGNNTTTIGAPPPGVFDARYELMQLVAGTSGTAIISLTYIDARGNAATLPLGSGLTVNATAGTRDEGAKSIWHNGGVMGYTISGVTSAGAWSAHLGLAVSKKD